MIKNLFDYFAIKIILKKYHSDLTTFKTSPYFKEYVQNRKEIKNVVNKTYYWHGTGRFLYLYKNKYIENKSINTTQDVLKNIIAMGYIKANPDPFIYFAKASLHNKFKYTIYSKPPKFVSLATYRLYALSFAITKNFSLKEYIFKPLTNLSFWFNLIFINQVLYYPGYIAVLFYNPLKNTKFGDVLKNWSKYYVKKVNKTEGFKRLVTTKTDIKNNYGITFGFLHTIKPFIKTSVAKTEVRTTKAISIKHISYIEVPYKYMEETKKIVGNKIKIIPSEFIDYYYLTTNSKNLFKS